MQLRISTTSTCNCIAWMLFANFFAPATKMFLIKVNGRNRFLYPLTTNQIYINYEQKVYKAI